MARERLPTFGEVRCDLASEGLSIGRLGSGDYRISYKLGEAVTKELSEATAQVATTIVHALNAGLAMADTRKRSEAFLEAEFPASIMAELQLFTEAREFLGRTCLPDDLELWQVIAGGRLPELARVINENVFPEAVVGKAGLAMARLHHSAPNCDIVMIYDAGVMVRRHVGGADCENVTVICRDKNRNLVARDKATPPVIVTLEGDGTPEGAAKARALSDQFEKAREFAVRSLPHGVFRSLYNYPSSERAPYALSHAVLRRVARESFAALDVRRIELKALEFDEEILAGL